jgi:hypothetical protein
MSLLIGFDQQAHHFVVGETFGYVVPGGMVRGVLAH